MTASNINKAIMCIIVFVLSVFTPTISLAYLDKSDSFHGIINFGDPNSDAFKKDFYQLEKPNVANRVVTITQFGDSHSAADFFTGELRTLLQAKYGNAGIGWVTPMSVAGQYHSLIAWKSSNWLLFSSRNTNDRDFPMGGYIAEPSRNNGYIQVLPKNVDINDIWSVKLTIKPLNKSTKVKLFDAEKNMRQITFTQKSKIGKWQISPIKITAPFTIKVNKGEAELGGIWLQRYQQSGVIVSMIGTNGAKQSIWQKWSPNWYTELAMTKSNMVILEYGTNEAFDPNLDLTEYRHNLIQNIKKIRKALPRAVVLVMSSPDTMLKGEQSDNVNNRKPVNYYHIRQIQQEVAKQEKTLYWDWQMAMGGDGIIEKWLYLDLARPDLIHLTKQGYIESAKIFYQDLLVFTQASKNKISNIR
ncbi:GDSL-type esterase/lipase family protein [Orbus sturtevantii]|uniref:GDSL-type esterase/lipase family protein n=1 Tax=Orbus sturtevantii TaxID=3074109 RepID=UPI00370DB2BE